MGILNVFGVTGGELPDRTGSRNALFLGKSQTGMVTGRCARNPVPDVDRSLRQGYSGCRLVARYCKIILAVGLSLSLGLHWCLLQSIAWASMLLSKPSTSTTRAATRTEPA